MYGTMIKASVIECLKGDTM